MANNCKAHGDGYSMVCAQCNFVAPYVGADLLQHATDADLSREWNRRHPAAGDMANAALRHATDDQLRAECERRWPNATNWAMWRKAEVERDSAVRDFAEAIAQRNEWKRRAEAAERASGVLRFSGPARARFDVEHGGCAICGAPPGAKCTPSCDDHAIADEHVQPWAECGPGIAGKPAAVESWPDPWDFLEDA